MNTQNLTPIEDWLSSFEEAILPSGKKPGLRQVDVVSILTDDGQIPNILMPIIQMLMDEATGRKSTKPTIEIDMQFGAQDLVDFHRALEKLTRACFAHPQIVDTQADVDAGKGILLHHVSLTDKLALIPWAMGGQRAIDAAKTFLGEWVKSLGSLQSGNGVPPIAQPNPQHSK